MSEGYDLFFWRASVIRAILTDRGISQADVARELGVSRQRVHQFFDGKSRTMFERIEMGLDAISMRRGLVPPKVVGTPEQDYIQHSVWFRDLMSAPPRRSASTRGRW